MQKEDCYFLGKITRKHGLSGNLILKLDTDQPEIYKKLESIFVEINGLLVPFFIEKIIWSKQDSLNILFKNSSEALVEQLIGKNVFLPLSTLPKLSGNQFYYHEVIGFEILEKEFEGKEVTRPPHLGGYLAKPYEIEFWQGRPNRLHDRIVYQFQDGKWKTSRLAP